MRFLCCQCQSSHSSLGISCQIFARFFSWEPFTSFQEEANQGSTCAELHGKKLEEIQIGEHTFTQRASTERLTFSFSKNERYSRSSLIDSQRNAN